MKKLIAFFVAGIFAVMASAQTDPMNPADNSQIQPQTSPGVTTQTRVQQQTTPSGQTIKTTKEYVEMTNGKVYRYKDGKSTVITTHENMGSISFNGDGTVTLKDGSRITLKEGDRITSDGRVIRNVDKARTNPPDEIEKY